MYIRLFSVVAFALTLMILPQGVFASESKTVEEQVRTFFATTPVMVEIARCESKFKQFSADGGALRGGWGGQMVGVFQFYESVHKSTATSLGFDLATLEGNLSYAKHVYAQQGTAPWNSSKACWEKPTVTEVVPESGKIVLLQKRVKELTKLLADLQKTSKAKKHISKLDIHKKPPQM